MLEGGIKTERNGEAVLLQFFIPLTADTVPSVISALPDPFPSSKDKNLTVDLADVGMMDDYGFFFIEELKKQSALRECNIEIININSDLESFLCDFRITETVPSEIELQGKDQCHSNDKDNLVTEIGAYALKVRDNLEGLIHFKGSVVLSIIKVLRKPSLLRTGDVWTAMRKIGVEAFPVVALISFLMGLIMAFMSAAQLKMFGGNIYVASLVSLAMARELGPIMTTIIMAGHSGSAFAAEIATMRINDEVDALVTIGVDPVIFLVVPKILASLIVVPLLTLFSIMIAIAGGLIVGVGMLDLTISSYMAQTAKSITIFDVIVGCSKSGVFAFLITWISCLRGFNARGGPSAVGNAATSAVVSSIFIIVVTDSIFAVIQRYW